MPYHNRLTIDPDYNSSLGLVALVAILAKTHSKMALSSCGDYLQSALGP